MKDNPMPFIKLKPRSLGLATMETERINIKFIRESEKEFGLPVKCLSPLSDDEFREYVDFLDYLWEK